MISTLAYIDQQQQLSLMEVTDSDALKPATTEGSVKPSPSNHRNNFLSNLPTDHLVITGINSPAITASNKSEKSGAVWRM